MKRTVLLFVMLSATLVYASNKEERATFKNALLWNTSYMTQGVFSFTYEYYTSPKSAIQVGLGITQENYVRDLEFDYDFMVPTVSSNSTENKYSDGFLAMLGYKQFIRDAAKAKGFYVNPQYRFRNYNYSTDYVLGNSGLDPYQTINKYENINELGCTIGYQTGGYIMFNFFLGGAYMIKEYTDVNKTTTITNPGSMVPNEAYSYQSKKKTSVSTVPWAGLSIGFLF